MFRRFRAAGDLPYGAFGEIYGKRRAGEMRQLPTESLPVASRGEIWKLISPATVLQITGWLPQVQPDGLLRWRPSFYQV
ncbi:hypothetical protein ACNKHU_17110 [Shigella flexneri]